MTSLRDRLSKPKTLSTLQSRLNSEKKTPLDLRELLAQIVREEVAKMAEPIIERFAGSLDKREIVKLARPIKGIDYRDGRDGNDGSPDTPDEIVSKIHKAGKKIFIANVAGLQRDLDKLEHGVELLDEEVKNKKEKKIEIKLDTPSETVEKVNKAGGVSISSVENLADELKKIRQRVSRDGIRSGGGMGNVQHEQFTLTTGTTSVTLAYNVAMNGYGIMGAYVQGQFLARGTHYTNSGGKTVSLLFTPDNNTTMDIVYIRTG